MKSNWIRARYDGHYDIEELLQWQFDDEYAGTIYAAHGRYWLGHKEAENTERYLSWEGWLQGEILDHHPDAIYAPVYAYIHGSVHLATKPFHCPWDSRQAGWIVYIPTSEMTEEERANMEESFEGTVETWDSLLNGEVFWVEVYERDDRTGETEMLFQANDIIGHELLQEVIEELQEEWEVADQQVFYPW